ncbi:two-component system response regulator [Spirochaetia bacterium]|nr:two-component system response regulator [Spirochaetia bacterium]
MPNVTILVVDDIDTNIMILEEILKNDYNILSANNGVQALDLLNTVKELPKIVLLDIFMPEMNGYQTLKIMKSDDRFKRIPVIFITTSDSEGEALAAGATDFISKPFMPDIVKLRVRHQVELKNYSDNLEVMVAQKAAELTLTLDSTLQTMANIIEYRNLESGSHVKRTQLFSQALIDHILEVPSLYADELQAQEPDIIVKSVALHDIGKIGIPDKILLKPGSLDKDEFEIMKTHTTIGKNIISSILTYTDTLYLKHCRDISYCHHERFDGKGYPQGLKGHDIPLSARIASLADIYDALVCNRVYKVAFPHAKAMQIIRDGRETQFDPFLTDRLLEVQETFESIARAII